MIKKKSLGQNFLKSKSALLAMISTGNVNSGDFVIEIIEDKIIPRSSYNDLKIHYILTIENKNNFIWRIPISNPAGYVNTKEDRDQLLIKVLEEVKQRIDLFCNDNNVDVIVISEPTLDLTIRRNKL